MAVSYVTEFGNVNSLSYALGKEIAPAFQKTNVMMNLMYAEDVPAETNVVHLEKSGSLTASALTEATAFALASGGELTDTYATLTAAAIGVASARSLHLQRFGGKRGSLPRFLDEQGKAIARYVDNDALAQFASLTHTVTSTTVQTIEDLILGQMTIFASDCPDQDVSLVYVGAPRSYANLKIEAAQTGAAAYANDVMLGIFKDTEGKPAANGYQGMVFPGIQGFQTTGQATSSSDTCNGLIHPKWCLAGIFDPSIIVMNADKVTEGAYQEVGSFYFYDVAIYNDFAGVQMKSDT